MNWIKYIQGNRENQSEPNPQFVCEVDGKVPPYIFELGRLRIDFITANQTLKRLLSQYHIFRCIPH